MFQANEEPAQITNNGRSRRSFQGIRKFFSSDRSTRSSQRSKSTRSKETNLPSISPQPPPLTSTSPNLGTGDRLSLPTESKTRSQQNIVKRKLISIETNLRSITARSRSVSSGSGISSSSSCGSGLWNADKSDTVQDATVINTNNEPIKNNEPSQITSQDSDEPAQKALEETSASTEHEVVQPVVMHMFTNSFDLK